MEIGSCSPKRTKLRLISLISKAAAFQSLNQMGETKKKKTIHKIGRASIAGSARCRSVRLHCRRAVVTAERLGAGEEGRRVVAGHEDDDLGLPV